MARYEGLIQAAQAFDLGDQGPRQYHISPRLDGQMQVGFTRDLHAARIDHHQLRALLTGAVDEWHEMEL